MPENIIEVENISKLYKLGSIGTGTLSHDLNRWWYKVRKKDHPYAFEGERNDRQAEGSSSYVWSLKDINFEIKQGEVFGVIGGNGAGKSTLLKILSKITKPTTGSIKMGGRVASLLEVGTGFHPELTGRENIFLNGAILGMRKQEIKNRFDEIVEFSEIGRYIDTPVKKYSSGMFVRLAFAVAAHLEPDILIIDEVLAVGDASFQSKCLGKMEDISKNYGRTVLFVSHNISAIKRLCSRAVLLEQGTLKITGNINEVLSFYQKEAPDAQAGKRNKLPVQNKGFYLEWNLKGSDSDSLHTCRSGDTCTFSFKLQILEGVKNCEAKFLLRYDEMLLLHLSSLDNNGSLLTLKPGFYQFEFTVQLPVSASTLDVEAVLISSTKEIDFWRSSTKLNVLGNLVSRQSDSLLNPESIFSIQEQPQEIFG